MTPIYFLVAITGGWGMAAGYFFVRMRYTRRLYVIQKDKNESLQRANQFLMEQSVRNVKDASLMHNLADVLATVGSPVQVRMEGPRPPRYVTMTYDPDSCSMIYSVSDRP